MPTHTEIYDKVSATLAPHAAAMFEVQMSR